MNKKKVIACVVARMNSTRLPRKSLLDIEGKTLVMRIIERLRESTMVDKIVICTSSHPDDAVLVNIANQEKKIGFIAGSERDVLSRLIEAGNKYEADVVLRVTGDNPFTDSIIIDQLVDHHIKTNSEYTRMIDLPIGVTPDVMELTMMNRLHDEMSDPDESEYLSLFAMNYNLYRCALLEAPEELRRPYYSLTVDTPEDLEKIKRLYNKYSTGGHIPSLNEVVLDMDQDAINNSIPGYSLVKIPGNKTKTYDELLAWWKEQYDMCS